MKLGNCKDLIKDLEDNSIDSIVTDPPYELGFMGKKWDNSGIAYDVELWAECSRVLKPGGHLIAFSGSRTYHRMAVAIEDAGFDIRDQIMWVYGSGFPKSHNVSKAIDKSDAVEMRRQRALKFTEWMRTTSISARIVNGLTASVMGSHYLTDKEQPLIATAEMFDKLRPHLPEVPEWVEQMVAERTIESENFKKREVVGKGSSTLINATGTNAVRSGEAVEEWQPKEYDLTTPATPAAKQWDGWGTALKPAHEPICVARKPLIGTVAENVLQYGTGGINIDGCMVGTEDTWQRLRGLREGLDGNFLKDMKEIPLFSNTLGRWPANFIHDGSAEVLAGFPESDRSSAARFFYCAKASKRDRNEGLDGFPQIKGGSMNGVETREGKPTNHPIRANHHPTVKPTDLMRYLCRLVTQPNGIILDPFTGSGSTGKAAILEGFSFVGFDMQSEYIDIATARIKDAEKIINSKLF